MAGARAPSPTTLIFLDLDNTLISSSHTVSSAYPHFFLSKGRAVHLRPHLKQFLLLLSGMVDDNKCRVGVWSAGETGYVTEVLHGICEALQLTEQVQRNLFQHVRCRDSTTEVMEGVYVKNLSDVDDTCLLLDDNWIHCRWNVGRVILIAPFHATLKELGGSDLLYAASLFESIL